MNLLYSVDHARYRRAYAGAIQAPGEKNGSPFVIQGDDGIPFLKVPLPNKDLVQRVIGVLATFMGRPGPGLAAVASGGTELPRLTRPSLV